MKKNYRVILSLVLVMFISFGLCACGESNTVKEAKTSQVSMAEASKESEVSDILTKEEVALLVEDQILANMEDMNCEMKFSEDVFYILIKNDDVSEALLLLAATPSYLAGSSMDKLMDAYDGTVDALNNITKSAKKVFDSAGYDECHVALGILDMTNREDILFVSQDGETYYSVVD